MGKRVERILLISKTLQDSQPIVDLPKVPSSLVHVRLSRQFNSKVLSMNKDRTLQLFLLSFPSYLLVKLCRRITFYCRPWEIVLAMADTAYYRTISRMGYTTTLA